MRERDRKVQREKANMKKKREEERKGRNDRRLREKR